MSCHREFPGYGKLETGFLANRILDALIVPQAGVFLTGKPDLEPEDSTCKAHGYLGGPANASLRQSKFRGRRDRRPRQLSLLEYEMAASILLPARFIAFGAEGFFFTV